MNIKNQKDMMIGFNLETADTVDTLAIGLILDEDEDWQNQQSEQLTDSNEIVVTKRNPPTLGEYFFFLRESNQ
jgi:hypothetical protein